MPQPHKSSAADAMIAAIAREFDRLQQQPIGPVLAQNFDEDGKLIRRRS
jgi:hypothetical protein